MFAFNTNNVFKIIDTQVNTCPESGAVQTTVSINRRHPANYGVYVGHPISGIRVGRIHEMQDDIRSAFIESNKGSVQNVDLYFPMRTTHLSAADLGANEYENSSALFAATRSFTLQNRMDALQNSDGILVNFEMKDDEGAYRVSKGIPFDYGWGAESGKPVVAVIGKGNPNLCLALERVAYITDDLRDGVRHLNAMLPHTRRTPNSPRVVAEIFDFTGCGPSLSMIAELAACDARKHRDGGSAIICVMPAGKNSPAWHGQVMQVADWVLPDVAQAEAVVRQLMAV